MGKPAATDRPRLPSLSHAFTLDGLITGRSKEVLAQEVKPLVEHVLAERGLSLSPAKTVITHIDEGFDFPGQHVRKYQGKLRIKPSPKASRRFWGGRGRSRGNKPTPAGQLMGQLNPLRRGWANYHRHVGSKVTFAKMDHAIFQALWRWATRRHPNKPPGWIRRKYFTCIANNHAVFQARPLANAKPRPSG